MSKPAAASRLTRRNFLRRALLATGVALAVPVPQPLAIARARTADLPSGQETITINFWEFGGLLTEIEWFKQQAELFNQSQTRIKVVHTAQDWATRKEKMITTWTSARDQMPDVFTMFHEAIPEFVPLGMLVQFDQEFPSQVEEVKKRVVPEAFLPNVWKDGHLYAMPTYCDLDPALGYNTQMFQDAGLEPPTSWKQIESAAIALTRGDVAGFSFSASSKGSDASIWARMFHAMLGGRWVSDDGKKAQFNDDAGVSLLQWYQDLNVKHKVTPPNLLEMDYMKMVQTFFQSKLAMTPGGIWIPGIAKDIGAPEGFPYIMKVPFPAPDKDQFKFGAYPPASGFITASTSLFMSASSPNKQAAWEWIAWCQRDEFLMGWAGDPIIGRAPIAYAALNSELLAQKQPWLVEPWKNGTLFANRIPQISFTGSVEADKITDEAIANIVSGKAEPKAALDEAAERVQAVLDSLQE